MVKSSHNLIVGIDEVGRGPLAGPVYAAAVCLKKPIIGLNDSKKLSSKIREKLFVEIQENAFIGIGLASVEEIDKINILQASLLAMQRAYLALEINADLVLIDGNKAPKISANEIQTIIGGDAKIPSISAASIIAKVTRDRLMNDLSRKFPYYLWDKNAGYGTKAHLDAIEKYGICQHHRKTFAPIKNILKSK